MDINGFLWRKKNENDEIIIYKAQLVAQGFSQRPGIDYEKTYFPIMDAITLWYLISLTVSEGLDIYLINVVTTYLYESINTDIYMKIPEGFKLPETTNPKPRNMYSIKLQRSLYVLKQSGRMWYNRLTEYLLKEGYVNNSICPYVFIKKSKFGLTIITVYVDDLNLIWTPEELTKAANYLKKEFEMKDLFLNRKKNIRFIIYNWIFFFQLKFPIRMKNEIPSLMSITKYFVCSDRKSVV